MRGAGLMRVLTVLFGLAALGTGVAGAAGIGQRNWWFVAGCVMTVLALAGCAMCAWMAAGDAGRAALDAASAATQAEQLRYACDYERAVLMQMAGLVLIFSADLGLSAYTPEWALLYAMAQRQAGRLDSLTESDPRRHSPR